MLPSHPATIALDDAQRIIEHYYSNHTVSSLVPLQNEGYSGTKDTSRYILDLRKNGAATSSQQCCFLIISSPTPPKTTETYHPNTLQTSFELFSLVLAHTTSIRTPPSTLDTSLELIPYHFLLSPLNPFPSTRLVSLSHAREEGIFSERENVIIDIRLGQFFGQVHSRVQNDWFGIPVPVSSSSSPSPPSTLPNFFASLIPSFKPQPVPGPPDDSAYSWQETFTTLFEDLLYRVESDAHGYRLPPDLPSFADVKKYLSRAIGSFLFDDVEVPALVWFTGSETEVYIVGPPSASSSTNVSQPDGEAVAQDPEPEPEPGTIAFIIPSFSHALWGDPLLESIMIGQPSEAFMEGYKDGGGGALLVFPRQKTKRIWYTAFLALVVLTKYGPVKEKDGREEDEDEWVREKRRWARETLKTSFERLKNAPAY